MTCAQAGRYCPNCPIDILGRRHASTPSLYQTVWLLPQESEQGGATADAAARSAQCRVGPPQKQPAKGSEDLPSTGGYPGGCSGSGRYTSDTARNEGVSETGEEQDSRRAAHHVATATSVRSRAKSEAGNARRSRAASCGRAAQPRGHGDQQRVRARAAEPKAREATRGEAEQPAAAKRRSRHHSAAHEARAAEPKAREATRGEAEQPAAKRRSQPLSSA